MASNPPSLLLGLPDELLQLIIDAFDYTDDLNSFSRTCRSLFHLILPSLYRLYKYIHGESPLGRAARRGNLDTFTRATTDGLANCRLEHLNAAISNRHVHLVRFLVGNTVLLQDWESRASNLGTRYVELPLTPLCMAVCQSDIEIVEILLNVQVVVDESLNPSTSPPIRSALAHAAILGLDEIVKLLIHHGASVDLETTEDNTPLVLATQEGRISTVRVLLEHGADIKRMTGPGFSPPIAHVIKQNLKDIFKALLKHGLDTSSLVEGRPMIECAARYSFGIFRILVSRSAEKLPRGLSTLTLLEEAIDGHQCDVAEYLLRKSIVQFTDLSHRERQTALRSAWKCRPMLELLFRHGADVNALDPDGLNPLHRIIVKLRATVPRLDGAWYRIPRVLLEAGADPNALTARGETPLFLACGPSFGVSRALSQLLEFGADMDHLEMLYSPRLEDLLHSGAVTKHNNERGMTHLSYAILEEHKFSASKFVSHGATFTVVNGRDVVTRDMTFRDYLPHVKNPSMMRWLLCQGLNPSVISNDGMNAFHRLVKRGGNPRGMLHWLLDHDCDLEQPDRQGNGPLHLACMNPGSRQILQSLILQGANITARSKEGYMPLEVARASGNDPAVKILTKELARVARRGPRPIASRPIPNGALAIRSLDDRERFSKLQSYARNGTRRASRSETF